MNQERPVRGMKKGCRMPLNYLKGYADYIIFSSGYKFIFEEAMIMKSLAIALGIPESAIIIEDKAANTYQNVKFVKDILYKKKWGVFY